MKFLYEYQDKANKRHFGSLTALTRGDAYAALKAQGIKPIRCDAAPGVFNLLLGRGKRWFAIVLLALAAGVATIGYYSTSSTVLALSSQLSHLDSRTRRQPIGDAAVIEKGIRTGWSDVFELEGERFLASFAIPGVPAGQRSTTEDEINKALAHVPVLSSSDAQAIEARQVVAMVEGMKDELRRFLAAKGTVAEYGQRLIARQEEELGYYNRAKQEIEVAIRSGMQERDILALWEKRNAALRKMGVKLISLPEETGSQNF